MAAVALVRGDEVERVGVGGVRRGLDGRGADECDRRRRQPHPCVRVVGSVGTQIDRVQFTVIGIAQSINDRRVGLQAHADAETVQVQTCDLGQFFRQAALLLDDGCHDQQIVRGLQRQPRITAGPRGIQDAGQRGVRLAQQVEVDGARGEPVGLGQKLPFCTHARSPEFPHEISGRAGPRRDGRYDIGIPSHGREQLLDPPAIHDGQRMQQHLAAHHLLEQRPRREPGFDFILPGLDGGRNALPSSIQDPGPWLRDDALPAELRRNSRETQARRHLERCRNGHVHGFIEAQNCAPNRDRSPRHREHQNPDSKA